ncbi:probable calcium-binding protein CML36 [Zingiber officinale]|uniref:EF-hand domain-containing protein n=1 Tax=Zingiber officinale TaxID=94328 RepID=A0A8J5GH30_ZINOF|nr:probable calcium-binding protein CML36 [Zingiber officinale]KAG6507437.1 hypothetical protein ZIOFF_032781 [Zingiber officinale]
MPINAAGKKKSAREASWKLPSRHPLPFFLTSVETVAKARKRKKRRPTKATSDSAMKLSVPSFFASHFKRSGKKSSSRRSSSDASTDGDSSTSSSSSLFHPHQAAASPCSVLLPSFTAQELEAALRSLGPIDAGGGVDLTEAELAALLAEPSPEAEEELREAFAVFDSDGDGKISAEELRRVLETLGDEGCSLDDCRRMIHGIDTDGDGFVCFNDFARMMDGQRCF